MNKFKKSKNSKICTAKKNLPVAFFYPSLQGTASRNSCGLAFGSNQFFALLSI